MSTSKKTEKWLNLSVNDIIYESKFPRDGRDGKFLEKFLEMGIPVLKKYKSGFMGETGDIQVCLLIHLEEDDNLKTEICHINDEGELKSRINCLRSDAINVIKAFSWEFPEAVFTTPSRKPLCLFTNKKDNLYKKNALSSAAPDPKIQISMGMFVGYMNFKTFKQILSVDTNQITVAVP
jgi:hypothetical protein